VCDSINHCEDKSDEASCTYQPLPTLAPVNIKIPTTEKPVKNGMYAPDEKTLSTVDNNNKKNNQNYKNENEDALNQLLRDNLNNNPEGTGDYIQDDDYDAQLLRQQNLILDHLRALEEEKYNDKLQKKKVVFETDKNFLDKFLVPNKDDGDVDNSFPPRLNKKKTTTTLSSKQATKSTFNFHGIKIRVVSLCCLNVFFGFSMFV
jgi:hypothetical protein